MMNIAGLVLAGGQGLRMGGADKALLPLAGQPLIAHVLARFAPQVATVAISANGDLGRFAGCGFVVLSDNEADTGPLAGVLAGLTWAAAQGASWLATVAVDTPFFPDDMVARLAAAPGGAAVVMAESLGRLHPTCGLWRVGLLPVLAAALATGERRLARFAAHQGMVRVAFPAAGSDPFFNINHPADLAAAHLRLVAAG